MNKKISFLLGVIIGEWLPIDTLKLQQSSPLSGSDLEVTTAWSKSGGRGGDCLGIKQCSGIPKQAFPCSILLSIPERSRQGTERGGDCIEAKRKKKKIPGLNIPSFLPWKCLKSQACLSPS